MKIAIAVGSTNMEVAKRMGHAPWFAIYNIENSTYALEKLAENEHAKEHHSGGHHHEENSEAEIEKHRQDLAPLSGIDAILTRAVGPHMKEALLREGISIYRFPLKAGKTAEDLLDFYIQNQQGIEDYRI